MKPDGRSLDIVVVGLGQGGGNIATEFFRRGYHAIALNTAESDLHALDPGGVFPALPSERRLYIGMDGYDGAGADPEYGSQCVAEHAEAIRDLVRTHAARADAVVLTAGLGGGTGSSVRALVKALEPLELPLLALMTLPTDDESGIAKVNAVRAINEMVDAPLMGWIFVDNHRLSVLNQDISIVDYFAHVNDRIAAPLDGLNRLNDREDLRSIRSFDGEDLRKLLLSGGVLNYGVVELPQITVEEVVGALRDALAESDLMPRGFDVGSVSYLGLVIEASDAALADVPMATFQRIDEQVKKETGGAAVYRGIYRSTQQTAPILLRFMAACQVLPSRIRELITDARKEGGAIRDKLQVSLHHLDLGEVEGFDLFRPGAKNRGSERPRRLAEGDPVPDVEDLRLGIMRPKRPAQSPQIKRVTAERGPSSSAPEARPSIAAEKPTAVPAPAEPAELPRKPKLVAPPPPPKPSPLHRPGPPMRVVPAAEVHKPEPREPVRAAPEPKAPAPEPKAPEPKAQAPEPKASEPKPPPSLPPPPPPRAETPRIERAPARIAADDVIDTRDGSVRAALDSKAGAPPKRPTAPIPVEASSLLEEGSGESVTHEIDLELEREKSRSSAGHLPPPPPGATGPEEYDRLVAEFLHTEDNDVRDDIADRLELDGQSEQTVIRYYAVEAMAKLGRETFGPALLAATEDENDAVRAIAIEALRR